jgi:hypothetical protein
LNPPRRARNGVQDFLRAIKRLDSGFRRNDGNGHFQAFYESI